MIRLRMHVMFLLLSIISLAALFSSALAGSKSAVYKNASGIALDGYDAVSYFADGEPVKGEGKFSSEWMGATWYFASEENLELFKKEPEKYAPKYGGYCAYAVGNNYTYRGDPLYWTIVAGRLYLNANAEAQQLWSKDIPAYIKKGDKNWPAVLNK